MHLVLDAFETRDSLAHWWHDVGSLAPRLPETIQPLWLGVISQVVRHFRSYSRSTCPTDKQRYRVQCQLSLVHVHAELASLMADGYLTLPHLNHLFSLEESLTQLLQEAE